MDKNYKIIEGKAPIIISAPHAVAQIRNARLKFAEPQTSDLAERLCSALSLYGIIKTRCDNDDANYDKADEYKTFLIDYVSKRGIKMLIDLHLMSPKRSIMVDIGTGKGANLCGKFALAERAVASFDKFGITAKIDNKFSALHAGTVSSTIARERNIPCLQVEINSRLVIDEYVEYRYNDVLNALIDLVSDTLTWL